MNDNATHIDTPVLLERDGTLALVTLNRPSAANTIDQPMAAALRHVAEDLANGSPCGAVLLKGAGRTFCNGGDLFAFNEQGAGAPRYVQKLIADFHVAVQLLSELRAPIVAAVHGAAAGAGLGLALVADIVVAAESSRFLMAYGAVGLTPDGGTSWALPRTVGLRRAMQMTLLNESLSAAEALAYGIVSRVVPDAELQARAHAIARDLARGPRDAQAAAKRLLRESSNRALAAHLAEEGRQIVESFATPEGAAGVRAFCERKGRGP